MYIALSFFFLFFDLFYLITVGV